MGSKKLTAIDETECLSPSQSPENSFLQSSPTKLTITKTYSNKGKSMLIVNALSHNFQFTQIEIIDLQMVLHVRLLYAWLPLLVFLLQAFHGRFAEGSCSQNNGGCGPNAHCSENRTTTAITCTCKTGYANTGSQANVVCIVAASTMEDAIRVLFARMTYQHIRCCARVKLVIVTLVQIATLCAKTVAPPPEEDAIRMLLARMTTQHMPWCARVELVLLTLVQLPTLCVKILAPSTMEDAVRMLFAHIANQQMRYCAPVQLDTPTLVHVRELSARTHAPSTMEDAIRMLLAHMTIQHMP
ncbi:unnamed protein product [Rotaria magnacalcarata]